MTDCGIVNTVVSLYKEDKWEQILKLGDDFPNENVRKLLWVWPSIDNLNFIKQTVASYKLKGVLSIGCGSGLFEWLLHRCTGLPVLGYEVNREWWISKYCCPQFISLQFPNMPPKVEDLPQDFALMFCYFNNGPAFVEYISAYGGNLLFIIGPGKGRGTHTNPEPFKPGLTNSWKLHSFVEIKDTKDFITVYIRT